MPRRRPSSQRAWALIVMLLWEHCFAAAAHINRFKTPVPLAAHGRPTSGRATSTPHDDLCGIVQADGNNPLGHGACSMATVTQVGQSSTYTIVSIVDGKAVTHSMMDAEFVATSSNGDCIRSCGVFTSTEHDANGAAVPIPLDFLVQPPIHVFPYVRRGSVPQAAATFPVPYADIDYRKLDLTPGGANDPAYTTAINQVLLELANPGLGSRRQLRALGVAYAAGAPLPPIMHPAVAVHIAEGITMRLAAYRCLKFMADKSPRRGGASKSFYEIADPHGGSPYLRTALGSNGEGTLAGVPIAADLWAASEHLKSLPARLEYAQGLALSRLLFQDVLGGFEEADLEAPHWLAALSTTATSELELSLEELTAYAPHLGAQAATEADAGGPKRALSGEAAPKYRITLASGTPTTHQRRLGGRRLWSLRAAWRAVTRAGETQGENVGLLAGRAAENAGAKIVGEAAGAATHAAGAVAAKAASSLSKLSKFFIAIATVGGLAGGGAALLYFLKKPGGPGPKPPLDALWRALNNVTAWANQTYETVMGMQGTQRDMGIALAFDTESINHLWETYNKTAAIQEGINKNTNSSLQYLYGEAAAAELKIAALALSMAQGLEGLQEEFKAVGDTILSLKDMVVANNGNAMTSIGYLMSVQANQNSVIETIWSILERAAIDADVREELTFAAANAEMYVEASGWVPTVDPVARAAVGQEPPEWWILGSPRRAVYVMVLAVYWTELGPTLTMPPSGDTSSFYSTTVANFVGHFREVSVVCDRASLSYVYSSSLSSQKLLAQIGIQRGCLTAMTNVSLSDFLFTEAKRVDPDAVGCRCWLEEVESTCPVRVTSGHDRVIWDVLNATKLDPFRALTAAGLAGITSAGNVRSHTPCVAGVPLTQLRRRVSTGGSDWESIWSNIGRNPRLRTGDPGVPSIFMGPIDLGVVNTTAFATRANAIPLTLYGISHPFRAASDAAESYTDSGNPTPYTAAAALLGQSISLVEPRLRVATAKEYGFLSNDMTVHKYFAFDADSYVPYDYYELTFGGTQGKLEPVFQYMAAAGGPLRRIDYYMPSIPAVPGVHAARPVFQGFMDNPEVYEPAAGILPAGLITAGDPKCWLANCSLPCAGAAQYIGQCDPGFTGHRSVGAYGYNLDPAFSALPRRTVDRRGPLYNIVKQLTPVHGGGTGYEEDSTFSAFNLSRWSDENGGVLYDPVAGGSSLDDMKTYFTSARNSPLGIGDIHCRGQASSAPGDLCQILENYYVMVPDVTVGGRQEYLIGTPAAACATPPGADGGVLCFVPRSYTARWITQMRMGEVHATIGSVCPSVFAMDAELRGTLGVTLQNLVGAPAGFRYRWLSRGLNDTIDAPITHAQRALVCVSDTQPRDGGILPPNTAIALPFGSPCAAWTLVLYALNGATGEFEPCSRTDITFLLRTATNPDVPITVHITTVVDNSNAFAAIRAGAVAAAAASNAFNLRIAALEAAVAANDVPFREILAPTKADVDAAAAAAAAIAAGAASRAQAIEDAAAEAARAAAIAVDAYNRAQASAAGHAQSFADHAASAAAQLASDLARDESNLGHMGSLLDNLVEAVAIAGSEVAKFDASWSDFTSTNCAFIDTMDVWSVEYWKCLMIEIATLLEYALLVAFLLYGILFVLKRCSGGGFGSIGVGLVALCCCCCGCGRDHSKYENVDEPENHRV